MVSDDDWLDYGPDSTEAKPFTAELLKELGPGHQLFGSAFTVVARRYAQDDILITTGDRGGCAAVHLTWKQSPEALPYPSTTSYPSMASAKDTLDES